MVSSKLGQNSTEALESIFNPRYDTRLMTSLSMANMEKVYESQEKINHKRYMEDICTLLDKEQSAMIFRIIFDQKQDQFTQISEVLMPKNSKVDFNLTYLLKTRSEKEYYVKIKAAKDENGLAENEIKVSPILAKGLEVTRFEKVFLEKKEIFRNCVDKIELIPVTKLQAQIEKDVEEKFKKFIIRSTRLVPLILNQKQVLKVEDYVVTVKLHPESIQVACVDADILRKNIIEVSKEFQRNDLTSMMREPLIPDQKKDISNILNLSKFESLINNSFEKLQESLKSDKVFSKVHSNCIFYGK